MPACVNFVHYKHSSIDGNITPFYQLLQKLPPPIELSALSYNQKRHPVNSLQSVSRNEAYCGINQLMDVTNIYLWVS